MALKTRQLNKTLQALQKQSKKLSKLENELKNSILVFFNRLEQDIIQKLESTEDQVDLSPLFQKYLQLYQALIYYYNLKAYSVGTDTAKMVVETTTTPIATKAVEILDDTETLFRPKPSVNREIRSISYSSSEKTLKQIENDVHKTLSKGYMDGLGNRQIAENLTQQFTTQLSPSRAERIAVTEINSSQNVATFNSYQEMGVEYIQWSSANDNRVRPDHQERDGEIIKIGDYFGNGLQFPGDRSHGTGKDWIWCRCTSIPFIMPMDKLPPVHSPFRETELIDNPYYDKPKTIEEALERRFGRKTPTTDTVQTTLKPVSKPKPKSKKKFEKLHKPEDVAEYFGYEYEYYEDTGVMLFKDTEHDTDIIFDEFWTKNKQSKKLLDINSKGKAKYDLKDVLKYYDDAPDLMKDAPPHIIFTKQTVRDPWIAGSTYKYDGHINMFPRAFQGFNNAENLERLLRHEMSHSVDMLLKGGRPSDLKEFLQVLRTSVDRNQHFIEQLEKKFANKNAYLREVNARNWIPTSQYAKGGYLNEEFAEIGSMASYLISGDKEHAVIKSVMGELMELDEFVEMFEERVNYYIDILQTKTKDDLVRPTAEAIKEGRLIKDKDVNWKVLGEYI